MIYYIKRYKTCYKQFKNNHNNYINGAHRNVYTVLDAGTDSVLLYSDFGATTLDAASGTAGGNRFQIMLSFVYNTV